MPARALSLAEVAAELGRPTRWMYYNWRDLCDKHGMPRPLLADTSPAWSAAQLYAWMDRGLTKSQRIAAAAYRAACEAVADPDARLIDMSVADAQARLQAKFVRSSSPEGDSAPQMKESAA